MTNLGDCELLQTFIDSINENGLEHELDIILDAIRRNINQDVISPFVRSPRLIYVNHNGRKTRVMLDPQIRIMELTTQEFQWNFPTNPLSRGIFQWGVIFLRRQNWCRKVLIHEALHSLQNLEFDALPEVRLFVEGLTEYFTGYLLSSQYVYCHEAWKLGTYSYCSTSYTQWVKMFGAFCHFLPLSLLKPIYFHDGISWKEKYQDFLDNIHKAGYPDFGDVFLGKKKIPLELRFLQECHGSFGKQLFNDVYKSKERCLDFRNIVE